MALAVIAKLGDMASAGIEPEQNRERQIALRNRFIGEKDPASLVESSKLFLNQTDDAFYQDYLVQLRKPANPRDMPGSNRLLWQCFTYYRTRLDEIKELRFDGALGAELLSETIARRLIFIQITVDHDINAYTVFETLNARGIELSSTDLLENYLFSRVKVDNDLVAFQRRWRALIPTITQEHFPEFLRYHLLCSYPKVRSRRLFKIIRDQVRTPPEVFDLIQELEPRSELFCNI